MRVLKFSGEWCAPCKVLSATLERLGLPVEEKDVEKDIHEATKRGIKTVPTLIKVDDNDVEIGRIQGTASEHALKEFFGK